MLQCTNVRLLNHMPHVVVGFRTTKWITTKHKKKMRLDTLIEILQHARKTLPGNQPVCFSCGYGEDARVFDFGEGQRDTYSLAVTIRETEAYVDGFGRFHFPIREVPEERREQKLKPTPEDAAWFEKQKAYIQTLFTEPHKVRVRRPNTVWPDF
jgi:hypothetical protein